MAKNTYHRTSQRCPVTTVEYKNTYFGLDDIMYLCNVGSLIQTNINDRNNIIPDWAGCC